MGIRDHKLRVMQENHIPKVFLDDQEIGHCLAGLTVRYAPGSLPTATLDVVVFELPAEADRVRVDVPEETAALLVELGWTPPRGHE